MFFRLRIQTNDYFCDQIFSFLKLKVHLLVFCHGAFNHITQPSSTNGAPPRDLSTERPLVITLSNTVLWSRDSKFAEEDSES